jgi:hypothetical protein
MSLELFVRYGSLWTLILGVLSLGFAVRSYRRQVNAQIFFEIFGRYHDMLRAFPVHEWTGQFNSKNELPPSNTEVTSGVLRYMAIVHFAFMLHDLRYLSNDLWRILQAEHHRTLATPLFAREWRELRIEFNFFPTFVGYVDAVQQGNVNAGPGFAFAKTWRTSRTQRSQSERGSSADSEFPG